MKEKRNVPYFFDNMEETITKEEALGFMVYAASRNVHYLKMYSIYDDMIDALGRYSREDAKYMCAQIWVKRTLDEE